MFADTSIDYNLKPVINQFLEKFNIFTAKKKQNIIFLIIIE